MLIFVYVVLQKVYFSIVEPLVVWILLHREKNVLTVRGTWRFYDELQNFIPLNLEGV